MKDLTSFPGGEKPGPEETPEQEQTFGDLSLLVDLGIMDIVGDSQLSLLPMSPERVAGTLGEQLFIERPGGILAIGQVPEAVRWVRDPHVLTNS